MKKFFSENVNIIISVLILIAIIGPVFLLGVDQVNNRSVKYYECSSADNEKMSKWVEDCYMSKWNTIKWCQGRANELYCKKESKK